MWLWISTIAVPLGPELDAELARGRRLEADGGPGEGEPFLPPRDTKATDAGRGAAVVEATARE
ncbi:hypothetical protein QRX50_29110 [Amycolatopsis carbonis]|uniref:Uncharacterized protein n=1 Tax=Amycolatopsis carbonis TaxID=715471 RepID=A0A9Y2IAT1_9PSEU|nr:hypothetical protein [Amycolatopsis sp. 2-15]WIX75561.1 hypothetical protein QRX50_29110 [Amycolatopsis sp. 2-15]